MRKPLVTASTFVCGFKVPKGKKAVLVDDKTWLVVDKNKPAQEVRANWKERIEEQDHSRRMKRIVS